MSRAGGASTEALRITTRPALVAACGRSALAALLGLALVVSVWKGLPLTASVLAAGGPAEVPGAIARGSARSGHGFHDGPR